MMVKLLATALPPLMVMVPLAVSPMVRVPPGTIHGLAPAGLGDTLPDSVMAA
jgi:hypothetical protein